MGFSRKAVERPFFLLKPRQLVQKILGKLLVLSQSESGGGRCGSYTAEAGLL
jgi:hypothetical protein